MNKLNFMIGYKTKKLFIFSFIVAVELIKETRERNISYIGLNLYFG